VNSPNHQQDPLNPKGVADAILTYPAAILEFLKVKGGSLAAKLGYIRQRPPPDGARSGAEGGEGEGFQCMKSLDEPVVVEGLPVLVSQPQDCHQGGLTQLFDPNV